jgi:hypothetical protein
MSRRSILCGVQFRYVCRKILNSVAAVSGFFLITLSARAALGQEFEWADEMPFHPIATLKPV